MQSRKKSKALFGLHSGNIHCIKNKVYFYKIHRMWIHCMQSKYSVSNKFVICCIVFNYRISASFLYLVYSYKLLNLFLFCNPLYFLQNTEFGPITLYLTNTLYFFLGKKIALGTKNWNLQNTVYFDRIHTVFCKNTANRTAP